MGLPAVGRGRRALIVERALPEERYPDLAEKVATVSMYEHAATQAAGTHQELAVRPKDEPVIS